MELQIFDKSSSSSSEEELLDYVRLVPHPRNIRDRINPFENYNDEEFQIRFRLRKDTVINILELIQHNIAPITNRNKSISPTNQVLCTLRFLATGTYQNMVGDTLGIHKSTASKILKRVLHAIAALADNYIRMPETPQEITEVKTKFAAMHGFPNVIGCIDGTHIRIQSPGGNNAELYRNRKGYFSYNIQVVCDPLLKIRNIDARWPGSTHDSSVFNASYLKIRMEQEFHDCILLGDSAYPCRNYLMTPLLNPLTEQQIRYNNAHIHTRNSVERCFGVLKRRFPALAVGMRTAKETTLVAIVAAAVLHNIAIDSNNPELEALDPEEQNEVAPNEVPDVNRNDGNMARRALIANYFV